MSGRSYLEKMKFSTFTRSSRRVFLSVDGLLVDQKHGPVLLVALRFLRR